jgi:FKBP-type peptidyl-prolyl cis-trans isomerase 2
MPPGLVQGVEGLSTGDHVRLALAPEEAFGRVDPASFQELPKEQFPASALHVGFSGEVAGPNGTTIAFRIHAIQEDTVTLDFNHPLAGEHVVFEVTVVHVQD